MVPFSQRRLMLAGAIATLALPSLGAGALAQDASASPDIQGQGGAAATAHPLHIHSGTCDQLGDVVFPLGEISTDLMVDGSPAGDDSVGSATNEDVELNVTTVAATIDELTSSDHAINIHRSEQAMDEYIACGDIGGTRFNGDSLVIRLNPLNDSGYVGFALLKEAEDGNTTVYSMLTDVSDMTGTASQPMVEPSTAPTAEASMQPTAEASMQPMVEPSTEPTAEASMEPMVEPSTEPTAEASMEPMVDTSMQPTVDTSMQPTVDASPESSPDVTVEVTVDDSADVSVDVNDGSQASPAA